jgi:hypothetical protein
VTRPRVLLMIRCNHKLDCRILAAFQKDLRWQPSDKDLNWN